MSGENRMVLDSINTGALTGALEDLERQTEDVADLLESVGGHSLLSWAYRWQARRAGRHAAQFRVEQTRQEQLMRERGVLQ